MEVDETSPSKQKETSSVPALEDDDDDVPLIKKTITKKAKASAILDDSDDEPLNKKLPIKSEKSSKSSDKPTPKKATATTTDKTEKETPKDKKKQPPTKSTPSSSSQITEKDLDGIELKRKKPSGDSKKTDKTLEKKSDASSGDKETPKPKKAEKKEEPKNNKKAVKKEEESEDSSSSSESDSESESEEEKPTKKKTPAKKAANNKKKSSTPPAKRKKTNGDEDEKAESATDQENSDSDSTTSEDDSEKQEDSDDEKPKKRKAPAKKAPAKGKGKAKTTKATPKKATTSSSRSKKKSKEEETEDGDEEPSEAPKKGRGKKEEEEDEFQFKWWLEDPLPKGKKWKTLSHNGVYFPPSYQPHGVAMKYDGDDLELPVEAEEIATYFANYLETDHMKKKQFRTNFFKAFTTILDSHYRKEKSKSPVKSFDKCDFRPIFQHLQLQKEKKKAKTKEEKLADKAVNEKLAAKYGVAMVDGHKQKVANYRVEPPGLFLGRGDHPKAGTLKKRIMPEDVTLNLGKEAEIPECPLPGHKWGEIIHNDEVAWLAMWKDSITDSFKYVWLAPSSRIKQEADMKKFEVARKLATLIGTIRENYMAELKAKEMQVRQRATAVWIIDHLALRVGNEKDEDEADTVGCCSLRVEHIKLEEPDVVHFDFLGKDSMRYQNSVHVDAQVFKNLKIFLKDKEPSADLFDQLTTTALNNYLKEQMPGLTAKVFRTYNASVTLEKELAKLEMDDDTLVDEKMLLYNRANREVAILCNHQRTVSKNFGTQMGKIDEKIRELARDKQKHRNHLQFLKTGKKVKDEDESSESDEDDEKDKKKKSKKKKDSDDEEEEESEEKPKKRKKKMSDDPDKVLKAMNKIDERIKVLETKKLEKDDLKTVALSTSKINYIDPRISVAWAKKYSIPIEKIFSKALRQKFPWALDVDETFEF